MKDLVDKLNAALAAEEAAIDAYHRHREHGPHTNWGDHDSCSECVATSEAVRFHKPATGKRTLAAHRKILEIHKRYPNPYVPGESACQQCDEARHETYFSTEQACPTVLALAEEYDLTDDSGSG